MEFGIYHILHELLSFKRSCFDVVMPNKMNPVFTAERKDSISLVSMSGFFVVVKFDNLQ